MDIDVQAGETRYFSFSTGSCGISTASVCIQWQLEEVAPSVGQAALSDKRFQPNTGMGKLKLRHAQNP